MRNSTRKKLFIKPETGDGNEYRITSAGDRLANGNLLTTLSVNGNAVVIIEYANEKDGFSVYINTSRAAHEIRENLGLPPKEF